jgi:hypothetical protein
MGFRGVPLFQGAGDRVVPRHIDGTYLSHHHGAVLLHVIGERVAGLGMQFLPDLFRNGGLALAGHLSDVHPTLLTSLHLNYHTPVDSGEALPRFN